MSYPVCVPVVGKDGDGNDINMIVDNDGNAKTATTANLFARDNNAIQDSSVEVTAFAKNGSELVAIGYTAKSDNGIAPTAWKYNGSWVMGTAPSTSVRAISVSYGNGKYLIADGNAVHSATFNEASGKLATQSAKVQSTVDCITTGSSFSVGSSLSEYGTWTNKDGVQWDHSSLGIEARLYTGHWSTSFTFPGYAGSDARIQRIDAYPRSTKVNGKDVDLPPDTWDVFDEKAKGYYGLIGAPTLTVTWPKPAA